MFTKLISVGISHHRHHWLQTILLLIGIALGVAVVIAIDLANYSAKSSFRQSMQSIVGDATHQIYSEPYGVDENFYYKLRREEGIRNIAPVVSGYVKAKEWQDRSLQILGIDPFAEIPFRSYVSSYNEDISQNAFAHFLSEPNTVLISDKLAQKTNAQVGDTLTLRSGVHIASVKIVGYMKSDNALRQETMQSLLVADIASAQEILAMVGRLSHIDVKLAKDNPQEQEILNRITKMLPSGTKISLPQLRSKHSENMMEAFAFNLSCLSLLAIIIGIFLIYNTITFSIVQRRPVFGTLRALGVTNREIFIMVIAEIFVLSIFGSLLGVVFGIILTQIVMGFITQSITDFYFTLTASKLSISWLLIAKGMSIGVVSAVLAALAPAYEAMRVLPTGLLKRSDQERSIRRNLFTISSVGCFLLLVGAALLLVPSKSIELGFAGLFIVILGAAFMVPFFTIVLMRLFTLLLDLAMGLIGRMAPRNVTASLSRTSVAIASLMVAIATIIGVSIMIGSFRITVVSWLQNVLVADIFISNPEGNNGRTRGFPKEIMNEVQSLPEISHVAASRTLKITTEQYGMVFLNAVTKDISAPNRRYTWQTYPREQIEQKMLQGAVVVSESFAFHHNIKKGDSLYLPTKNGIQAFPIAGACYSYTSDKGIIIMMDNVYRKNWRDNEITAIAAYVKSGYNVDEAVNKLRTKLQKNRYEFFIQSNKNLREYAIGIFNRTFTITTALRLLVSLIAFIGILSTVMALQLERKREFGILRANGMTPWQIATLIVTETLMLGVTAGLLAIPLGTFMAATLIYVINVRSFGWTIDFLPAPEYYIYAFALAAIAAFVASLYPAYQATRSSVIDALRNE